jgi:hypothetical protein
MADRIDAKDAVKDLAAAGLSTTAIRKKLEEKGLGGLLDKAEVEMIVTQVRAAMNLRPQRTGKFWPRVIGVIAIVMGIGALSLGGPGAGRYNPGHYGVWVLILGIILVLKPGSAGSRID